MWKMITRIQCAVIAMVASAGAQAQIPAGLGWHELPGTRIRSVCPPMPGANCDGVTAYSGAVFDEAGNRMLIAGGGHNDYPGNEVYELNLDTRTVRRINSPSVHRDGCTNGGRNADGRPVARHTYTNIEYLPGSNLFFLFGGSQSYCGWFNDDTWTFDPANDTWQFRPSASKPRAEFNMAIVRDRNTGLLYARDQDHLWSYNPTTFSWTSRSQNDMALDAYKSAVIDPVRKRYHLYVSGTRVLRSYDISSPTGNLARIDTPAPTCAFMDQDAVGWQYDPNLDRLVAWNGGDSIYLMHPETAACTMQTIAGGPDAAQNGTYGRFRYSPVSGVYVSCNRVDDNCYALRLTPSGSAILFRNGFE